MKSVYIPDHIMQDDISNTELLLYVYIAGLWVYEWAIDWLEKYVWTTVSLEEKIENLEQKGYIKIIGKGKQTKIFSLLDEPIKRDISKTDKKQYWNKEINDLIAYIKQCCQENDLIYSGQGNKERQACKWILSKKFSETIDEYNMWLYEFINNVIMVSTKVRYTTKKATSAKDIYYNRQDIVNQAQKERREREEQQRTNKQRYIDLTLSNKNQVKWLK